VVAAVDTAEEGLAIAAKDRLDLVLMDIRLKGPKDGVQAAREIRDQVDVPIIYVTAYSDPRTLEQVRRSEHDGYILKPFHSRELRSTIDVAMQRHAIRVKQVKNISRDPTS
jgi:DNA-binding response OmpR family regulator